MIGAEAGYLSLQPFGNPLPPQYFPPHGYPPGFGYPAAVGHQVPTASTASLTEGLPLACNAPGADAAVADDVPQPVANQAVKTSVNPHQPAAATEAGQLYVLQTHDLHLHSQSAVSLDRMRSFKERLSRLPLCA
jgi:hypothetical protein